MKRIKAFLIYFMHEPLWFKIVIITSLLISIIFSSSAFSGQGYYDSLSKASAAIFFGTYGFRMRRNVKVAASFFVVALLCVYLAIAG